MKHRDNFTTVNTFLVKFVDNLDNLEIMRRTKAKKHKGKGKDKDPMAVCLRNEFGDYEKVIVDTIRSLTYSDYQYTQDDNKFHAGDLFIFYKEIKGVMLSVKIQINKFTGNSYVKSFHELRD